MSERDAYPSLTGLRFVLAAWITVYHIVAMYGPQDLANNPLIMAGHARVDMFFVLSGFVLAHVYAVRPQARSSGFDYKRFLVARAARLYPLHLLGLAIVAAGALAAIVIGQAENVAKFTLTGFLANLFMLQSVGIPGAGAWNFPSWTLSAEAFGYLLFPLFIMAGAAMRGRAMVFWGLALMVVGLVGLVWPLLGTGRLSEASQVLGFARGALCMLVGVAARYAFESVELSRLQALVLSIAGALIAFGSAILGLDLWLVAAGGSLMIFGIAALDGKGGTPLAHPVMEMLGRWSFGLFILHVPVFMLVVKAMEILGWDGVLTLPIGALLFAIAMVVGWFAHVYIEEPARHWIRRAYDRRGSSGAPAVKTL